MQPITCSAFSGIPCAAHKERTLREVAPLYRVLRRNVFPLFIPLLGSVKWHKIRTWLFCIEQ